MNWVFCNKCSLKFQSNIKFYLSECGHIFCQQCAIKMGQNKQCNVCNKKSTVMELSKDMDQSMQMFFWPLENVLQQSLKVFNFQAMHKSLFMQTMTKKYNYVKKECINYYSANKKLQKENQIMRDLLKSLGCNPPPFITSTPSKSMNNAYDHNLSDLSSIRFTPGSLPGSAQRMYYPERKSIAEDQLSSNLSIRDPSPAQTVPKGYPAPVHRQPTMQNPAVVTPIYMDKIRGKSGYPSLAYPRK